MNRDEPAAAVPTYYDRNTPWFLRTGGRAHSGSLHRVVWGPGVRSRAQALGYVDDLVAGVLDDRVRRGARPAHVLDLGCGVGSTATRLAQRPDVQVTGLTISGRQAALAQRRAHARGLAARCRFRQADMCEPGCLGDVPPVDLAVAIESLSHVADTGRVLAALAERVRPGGWLVVCDDFEGRGTARGGTRRQRWLWRFRRGWRLGGLRAAGELLTLAGRHGFNLVEDRNLSRYIRCHHEALLWLFHALEPIPLRAAVLDGLRGGAAGQRCLKAGWVEYRFLILQRATRASACTDLDARRGRH